MLSTLFEQDHQEVQAAQRFSQQNPQMLRVALGEDVLAVQGSMVVAFQDGSPFQYAFHGDGSVVAQRCEWRPPSTQTSSS